MCIRDRLLVCQEKIKEEIKFADFFSVIADETTDVSLTFQLAIVFRYVLPNGEPVERFWGFIHPPDMTQTRSLDAFMTPKKC